MRRALRSEALGFGIPPPCRASRSTATQPTTSGVVMLVPVLNIQSLSLVSLKLFDTVSKLFDAVDRIIEPGATASGLICFSKVGPRLLKIDTLPGLPMNWPVLGSSMVESKDVNVLSVTGRLLSHEPTVIQFFAAN